MLFPVGSLPPGPPIDTKKALLLLDFQNDFVSSKGKHPIPNVNTFIAKLPSLISEFRAKGEVIWCGTEFTHPRSSLSATIGSQCILSSQSLTLGDDDDDDDDCPIPKPTIATEDSPSCTTEPHDLTDPEAFLGPLKSSDARCCLPESPGVQYPDILQAAIDEQRDLVFLKSHYSAFVDTSLLVHLRTNLITELYVCGTMSNITVYATVLDAVCHGLQVCVVEDCLGYLNEDCHTEAMRHMADNMGANGIDCQELRDDLAGLLGDIVREEDFASTFEIRLPGPPRNATRPRSTAQQLDDWISQYDVDSDEEAALDIDGDSLSPHEQGVIVQNHSYANSESSSCKESRHTSTCHSPPRKRSPSALDPLEQANPPKSSHNPSNRISRPRTLTEHPKKQDFQPVHDLLSARHSPDAITPAMTSSIALHKTAKDVDQKPVKIQPESKQRITGPAPNQDFHNQSAASAGNKKKKKWSEARILESGDVIGHGDSFLHVQLLESEHASAAFYTCRNSIQWQKMFHRTGQVPRLVAVQGSVSNNGSQVPIYRHPADESPELQPFDSMVDRLRKEAERKVGHPLNHALIQWYRNSEDNISEHSDKSLDIVRGSKIVNLSLGARRTMILRTKKSAVVAETNIQTSDPARPSQRIHLPHNSLFILGPETNQHWLHAIRADKRLPSEKESSELAFGGERISFTFRYIGTFIDPVNNTIWGQGATAKTKHAAVALKTGAEAEREGEMMIRAFGQENHRSIDWSWDEWYGNGFDVINFETKPA